MCDVKKPWCMRGVECFTDHLLRRVRMSLVIQKKMRKFGSKVTKWVDISQVACAEKFERFQSAVQAEATDPSETPAKAMCDAAVDSFVFVSRKHQDWFSDHKELIYSLLKEQEKLLNRILSCSANSPRISNSKENLNTVNCTCDVSWAQQRIRDGWQKCGKFKFLQTNMIPNHYTIN